MDNGVQLRIDKFNAGNRRVDKFRGRNFARPKAAGKFSGVSIKKGVHLPIVRPGKADV